ncbi:MAG: carbohydrate binding family 9 domain-containing protein [Deltaproteobacteria bacterium]|nr:carbohydrate binding family 9 domain-containing protein [Deltaproteobacteria bacterium]
MRRAALAEQCSIPVLMLCLLASALPVRAAAPLNGPPELTATRINEVISIDGVLDEPAWQRAQVADTFWQREPDEGAPPSQRTEVRVLYSRSRLYVGVICFDTDPRAIVASRFDRDADLEPDDRVTLLFDTFHDHRNAFIFQVNAVGARFDQIITDEGQDQNRDWNGIWYARTRITEQGWTVEFAIPFQTLHFAKGQTTWGFNVQRVIKRRTEEAVWAGYRQNLDFFRVSEAGHLNGLEGAEQGAGLDVVPFLSTAAKRNAATFKPGLDVFYNLMPSLTLSLTANTDFGETEVDEAQVNLTRFPLFFPEKRQFFLEDAGNFAVNDLTPTSGPLVVIPFFSRRIGIADDGKPVDLMGGAKLSGRVGPYRLGLLNVQTQERGKIPDENLSVVRVKRDLFTKSSIGFIATHRDPARGAATGLVGSDFLYSTSTLWNDKNLAFSGFFLKSFIPKARKDLAWGNQLNLPNDTWTVFGTYREVQKDFDATLGFVPRKGIRRFGWFLEAAPRPHRWGTRQISCAFDGNYFADPDTNLLLMRNVSFPCEWRLDSGDLLTVRTQETFERLTQDFAISQGVTIPPGAYVFRRQRVQLRSADKRPVAVRLTYEWGDFYRGKRDDWIARLDLRPDPHFFLSTEYQQNDVRLPEGNFVVRLLRLRLSLALSPDLSWFNLVQYDTVSEILSLNSRLRWILEPGNDLFLVYNHGWRDTARALRPILREGRIKVQYTYRF